MKKSVLAEATESALLPKVHIQMGLNTENSYSGRPTVGWIECHLSADVKLVGEEYGEGIRERAAYHTFGWGYEPTYLGENETFITELSNMSHEA